MEVLGHGIYSTAEAAELLGISPQKMRAWFVGWGPDRVSMLTPDYCTRDSSAISFLDLVDATVAELLRQKYGFSARSIHSIRSRLQERWGPHPFARSELRIDEQTRELFLQISDEAQDQEVHEAISQQLVFPKLIAPFLSRLTYAPSRIAAKLQLSEGVVLDPARKYGKPIVDRSGMPTLILHKSYEGTRSFEATADWYGVSPGDVRAAVQFHRRFTGLAA